MKGEEEKIAIPKDGSEMKELKKAGEKSSKGSRQSKKGIVTKEKPDDDDSKPSDEQKISSFWTEIRTVPKSTEEKWVIPYNLEKNLYEYENVEIPKQIEAVLDREEFDRMMKQINTHKKIVSSSTQPHRKLGGVVLAAVGIFLAELYSDIIPQEALLAIVCIGFILVILILNYIEEQKDSFGEVKRREINSILRQYECFTEKEVLIDFDVSDFGSYITVVRLQNTKKLSHVLERDGEEGSGKIGPSTNTKEDSKKGSHDGFVNELPGPNKQITATGISDGKTSQDTEHLRKPEPHTMAKPEEQQVDIRPSLGEELANLKGHENLKQQKPSTPPMSSTDNNFGGQGQFYNGAQTKNQSPETHANPASELDIGDVNIPGEV